MEINIPLSREIERTGAKRNVVTTLAVAAAVTVFSLFLLALLPDGMNDCQQRQSFDTCHHALLR